MRRGLTGLLVLFVAFIVNFPLAHSVLLDRQLDESGIEVVADVTLAREVGDGYLVQFDVPGDGRRERFEGAVVEVDRDTYEDARSSQHIVVTVLPDNGGVFRAEGQQPNRLVLVVTLLADVFLLAMVLLVWRFRNTRRVELVLRATEDLERCPPGSRLDRIEGQRCLVSGDVLEIGHDEIVLDLGDRYVRVQLDGHSNPAGYQQAVQAIGYLVG